MLLLIIGYLLFGFIAVVGAAAIHVFRALMKGYDVVKWWEENYDLDNLVRTKNDMLKFVIGLFIWPVRLAQFLSNIPYLYEQYEPIQHEGMSQQ